MKNVDSLITEVRAILSNDGDNNTVVELSDLPRATYDSLRFQLKDKYNIVGFVNLGVVDPSRLRTYTLHVSTNQRRGQNA